MEKREWISGNEAFISMVAIEAGKERWKTMEWNGMKPPCVWLALLGIIDASPPQSLCQSAAQYNSSSKSTLIAHLMIHSNKTRGGLFERIN